MRVIIGLALSLSVLASDAFAQTSYPEQSIRILVGFLPGTAPDVVARAMADKLSTTLGKAVVVEGAGAAGLAAIVEHPERFEGRTVGVVLTGGNIDPRVLSAVILRGLVHHAPPRVRVFPALERAGRPDGGSAQRRGECE